MIRNGDIVVALTVVSLRRPTWRTEDKAVGLTKNPCGPTTSLPATVLKLARFQTGQLKVRNGGGVEWGVY